MADEAIRECPFCGSAASVESNNGLAFYGACHDRRRCHACVGPERCVADAIAAWNRRAGGEREQQLEARAEAFLQEFDAFMEHAGLYPDDLAEARNELRAALAEQTEAADGRRQRG